MARDWGAGHWQADEHQAPAIKQGKRASHRKLARTTGSASVIKLHNELWVPSTPNYDPKLSDEERLTLFGDHPDVLKLQLTGDIPAEYEDAYGDVAGRIYEQFKYKSDKVRSLFTDMTHEDQPDLVARLVPMFMRQDYTLLTGNEIIVIRGARVMDGAALPLTGTHAHTHAHARTRGALSHSRAA